MAEHEKLVEGENDLGAQALATLFITALPQECWQVNTQNETLSDPDPTALVDTHLQQFAGAWRALAEM